MEENKVGSPQILAQDKALRYVLCKTSKMAGLLLLYHVVHASCQNE